MSFLWDVKHTFVLGLLLLLVVVVVAEPRMGDWLKKKKDPLMTKEQEPGGATQSVEAPGRLNSRPACD